MAFRQGKDNCLLMNVVYNGSIGYISKEAVTNFYNLIKQYHNSEEFVVTGSKPQHPIMDGACPVGFQYDVNLFGRHLCTVYLFDVFKVKRDSVGKIVSIYKSEPIRYDIEINGNIYDCDDLARTIGIKDTSFIGRKVKKRWDNDQKKREETLHKEITQSTLDFVNSFPLQQNTKTY